MGLIAVLAKGQVFFGNMLFHLLFLSSKEHIILADLHSYALRGHVCISVLIDCNSFNLLAMGIHVCELFL